MKEEIEREGIAKENERERERDRDVERIASTCWVKPRPTEWTPTTTL